MKMAERLGHSMRKYFLFKKGWVNLNHGAFGTYPLPVRDYLRAFQDRAEATPDPLFRWEQKEDINKSRAELAKLLHAPLSTIVLISNVTAGINTVLRNIQWQPDDVIIYFTTSYGSCQNTIVSITETTPLTGHRIFLPLPFSDDQLVRLFTETVGEIRKQGKVPRAALIDTIVSLPGIRLPFERLVAACRDLGVLSVVDGAHGVGHIKLDLSELDPDFFTSNCHKWLFTPRGSAVMYVPERNQHMIRTTFPTSHYFHPAEPVPGAHFNPLPPPSGNDTVFTKQFEWIGTTDNSAITSVPTALKFRNEICGGEEKIMRYCSDLAKEGALEVARVLGTEILDNEESTLTKGTALVNVRLPLVAPPEWASQNATQTPQDGEPISLGDGNPWDVCHFIQTLAVDKYQTFVPICFYDGRWWARLAGQIYLEKQDFEYGASVLLDACNLIKRGYHLKTVDTKLQDLPDLSSLKMM